MGGGGVKIKGQYFSRLSIEERAITWDVSRQRAGIAIHVEKVKENLLFALFFVLKLFLEGHPKY